MARVAPPETSPERIETAAAELARERGIAGTTIAMVCQRSGLPVSSVYWHFEDKDSLFAEVIRSSYAAWLISAPSWEVREETTLEGGLRAILASAARTLASIPDFMGIGMQVVLQRDDQHARARAAFDEIRAQVERTIIAWLRAVGDRDLTPQQARDIAILVVAFSDGLMVGSLIYEDWTSDPYVDLFVDSIMTLVPAVGTSDSPLGTSERPAGTSRGPARATAP